MFDSYGNYLWFLVKDIDEIGLDVKSLNVVVILVGNVVVLLRGI